MSNINIRTKILSPKNDFKTFLPLLKIRIQNLKMIKTMLCIVYIVHTLIVVRKVEMTRGRTWLLLFSSSDNDSDDDDDYCIDSNLKYIHLRCMSHMLEIIAY